MLPDDPIDVRNEISRQRWEIGESGKLVIPFLAPASLAQPIHH
jgi:hypothetical protein